MIAADTSSLIAYFASEAGPDVEALDAALRAGDLALPPPVVTEFLAKPDDPAQAEYLLASVRMLPILDGFWLRAGRSRQRLLAAGYRAPTLDTLIAQACIDADVALITRDTDYQRFADLCGLKLA